LLTSIPGEALYGGMDIHNHAPLASAVQCGAELASPAPSSRRGITSWGSAPRRRDALCARLRALRQEPAAACLERDWEDFVTINDFPEEHWVHLRTSNPIESIFAGVRLRTDASKRLKVRENALYLVFKLVLRLSLNWRGINAPTNCGCCSPGTSSGTVNWSWRMVPLPHSHGRSAHEHHPRA
jgi:hypothetical protein